MKLPQQTQSVLCPQCGKMFSQMSYLNKHLQGHATVHPDDFDGNVIMMNNSKDGFGYAEYVDDPTRKRDIRHIVCIPWFDTDGNYVNISVGFTKYSGITHYAADMWKDINKELTTATCICLDAVPVD